MSDHEARRPNRAGQAYLVAIRDDSESQAALRRVQMGLQAFGAAVRAAIGPVYAAQNAAFAALPEPLHVYRDMGAALGNAMRGDFEKLRALVDAYPDLKEAAGELQQALLAIKKGDEQPLADIAKRFEHVQTALEDLMPRRVPPAFDDPQFWASIKPIGEQIKDAAREVVRAQAEKGAGGTRPRVNRAAAEQQIMEHLIRRPHDTAADIASEIGCSKGLVVESQAWRANQRRLRVAKELKAKTGRDIAPLALDLQDFLNRAGDNPYSQLHEHRRAQEAIDDAIDRRDRELYRQIAEYERQHPNATPHEVARAVGCMAGDVERRRLQLNRLVQEQTASDREDNPAAQRTSKHHKRV